jgi:hypothetical protein
MESMSWVISYQGFYHIYIVKSHQTQYGRKSYTYSNTPLAEGWWATESSIKIRIGFFFNSYFLGLLDKIKCNIYSYHFNIWSIDNMLTLILNLFIIGIFGEDPYDWFTSLNYWLHCGYDLTLPNQNHCNTPGVYIPLDNEYGFKHVISG